MKQDAQIPLRAMAKTPWFDIAVTALYACLIGYLAVQHTMWGDEGQEWLLIKNSHSLTDLYYNRRYEGHPILWYLVLYPIARLSDNYELIKIPDVVISIITLFVALRYFLRGRIEKLLLPLAPLFIFYFSLMGRPYMLGLLLVLLVLLCLRQPQRLNTALLLTGVMSNIHLYYLMIAATLLGYIVWQAGISLPALRSRSRWFWLCLAICLLLMVASVVQIYPPADADYTTGYRKSTLWNVPAYLTVALMPTFFQTVPFAAAACPILAAFVMAFRIDFRIAVFGLIGMTSLVVFQALVYGASAWHSATIYVCLLAMMLLLRDRKPEGALAFQLNSVILLVLAIQAVSGVILLNTVLTVPCSVARDVAQFSRQVCGGDCTYVVETASIGVPVAAYLGVPMYYVNEQRFGTFTILSTNRFHAHDPATVIATARTMRNPVILMHDEIPPALLEANKLQALKTFAGGMVADEIYYVYKFAAQ